MTTPLLHSAAQRLRGDAQRNRRHSECNLIRRKEAEAVMKIFIVSSRSAVAYVTESDGISSLVGASRPNRNTDGAFHFSCTCRLRQLTRAGRVKARLSRSFP